MKAKKIMDKINKLLEKEGKTEVVAFVVGENGNINWIHQYNEAHLTNPLAHEQIECFKKQADIFTEANRS